MRKAELFSIVRGLLPPGAPWPNNQSDIRLEGGKTVLMLAAKVPDARLAVKLIDLVCSLTANFWARDSHGRHVIMDACYDGVQPSVLLRLLKWARKRSLNVVIPMSRLDVQGLDALELAIREGRGAFGVVFAWATGPDLILRLTVQPFPAGSAGTRHRIQERAVREKHPSQQTRREASSARNGSTFELDHAVDAAPNVQEKALQRVHVRVGRCTLQHAGGCASHLHDQPRGDSPSRVVRCLQNVDKCFARAATNGKLVSAGEVVAATWCNHAAPELGATGYE